MKVVPPDVAKTCMSNFETIMQSNEPASIQNAFTASVSFPTIEFADWLLKNNYLQNTDSIRFSFGIYTREAATDLGVPEYEGRLTVFVLPIKNGIELDPCNLGDLLP